jgi:putative ABC transport system permease protein
MGIPVERGRPFTERDDDTSPNVAIVSEAFARKHWPEQNPIGQQLVIGYDKTGPREVVGVVGDVKRNSLEETTTGAVYAPYAQTPWPFMSAVVRTSGDPALAAAALRGLLPKLDPAQAPLEVKLLTDYVTRATATPRFTAGLIGSFAALALLLAGFGLYGVMAYSVVHRQREIGIRMALGAQPADVRSLVVRQAVRVGSLGLGIGLVGALAATRVLGSLLFDVSVADPLTYGAVSALLLAVVLAAAYLPARRATRIDPMVSLRSE